MEENALMTFPHTAEVLERYAKEFIERYKMELVNSGRPASGALIDSLKYQVKMDGNVFAVDISLKDYWKYIENGTAPHFPPLSAIRRWIEVKPVIPRPMENGKLPTLQQLAFLIGRKISEVGTKGSHDLERANDTLLSEMEMSIAAAVTEDLESQVAIIFSSFNAR